MEVCKKRCPHINICYHKQKYKSEHEQSFSLGLRGRVWILRDGYIIHESICNRLKPMHWHLLKSYSNYNITMSCEQYEPYLDKVKEQVQLTVYNVDQAEIFRDYQKLFLIKDDDTWEYFLKHWNMDFGIHKIHYIFEQNYITKDKLRIAAEKKMFSNDSSVTVDSCFTSYMLNARCPYSYNNYVDITYDGTMRSCPYMKTGKLMPFSFEDNFNEYKQLMDSVFQVETLTKKCKYLKFFEGELDGRK